MNVVDTQIQNDDNEFVQQADAAYKSFPSFKDWSKSHVNMERWKRNIEVLDKIRESSPIQLQQAQEIVKKVAAIETGALEDLYQVERGFTFTAAAEIHLWEASLRQQEEKVQNLIESQLSAYDYVLDFATKQQPIIEAWIRHLHAVLCKSQDTFKVLTSAGWQEQELPKGKYKEQPNHVRTASGKIHSYAPVLSTPIEMQRFCKELSTEEFINAHPILQASYAHYAFVVIHPFADGNGRVARALASVFTYRSLSIPLLITQDNKREYLNALELADEKTTSYLLTLYLNALLMQYA